METASQKSERLGLGNPDLLMSVDVETHVVINRSRHEVAAYASDPTNAQEWYVNIESVEWKTPPPVHVGSRVAFVAHFLGRRIAYTYEIVELVPDTTLTMRTWEGPFPMETTYTWKDLLDGATHMTLRNRGNPTGFSKLAAPFVAAAIRRSTNKDLRTLKGRLEGHGRR